jgi:type II secretory pathway pseudopilin PulG
MIKFFKKTRKQFMATNQTSKYLKYAIGEISLVVVGILLALYINNWSTQKTERKQEVKLLVQIKSDLEANQKEIERLKSVVGYIQNASDVVVESLEGKEKRPYFTIYASLLHRKYFLKTASSGYTLLNNGLITLIENTDLRNEIIQLYESTYSDLLTREEWALDFLDQNLNPQTNRLFKIQENVEINFPEIDETSFDVFTPTNFDQLCQNLEYINTLKAMRKMNVLRMIAIDGAEQKSIEVLKAINSSLALLENR